MIIAGKTVVGQKFAENEIYVARTMPGFAGSPLANPYPLSMKLDYLHVAILKSVGVVSSYGDKAERREVIPMYRVWLWTKIRERGPEYEELLRIARLEKSGATIRLMCWCAPLPCHVAIIASAVDWAIDTGLV
jgi:hypothetical protein